MKEMVKNIGFFHLNKINPIQLDKILKQQRLVDINIEENNEKVHLQRS